MNLKLIYAKILSALTKIRKNFELNIANAILKRSSAIKFEVRQVADEDYFEPLRRGDVLFRQDLLFKNCKPNDDSEVR